MGLAQAGRSHGRYGVGLLVPTLPAQSLAERFHFIAPLAFAARAVATTVVWAQAAVAKEIEAELLAHVVGK